MLNHQIFGFLCICVVQEFGDSPVVKSFGRHVTVIEAPKRVDLVLQLLHRLKPQIVVSSLADFEMKSSTAFERLLDACAAVGARLLLDISDHIELSSLPGTNGVLQYLAAQALPMHATIICGLLKNKVRVILCTEFSSICLIKN